MWISRRVLGVALGLSILANLFLAGVVTGRIAIGPDPRLGGHGRPLLPGVLVKALPPAQHRLFARAMRPHGQEINALHRALADSKSAAEAEIAATVYDRTKVDAAFAAVRHAYDLDQTALHAAYLDALAALTPAARASLVPRQIERQKAETR